MDLSVVLGGRDDNYGEHFIERLKQAVSYNLELLDKSCLLYTSPSPRDGLLSRMPSSA